MWISGGWIGKKEDKVFHDFVSPFLYFLGMANIFFFMGLHVPSLSFSFQYIAHVFIGENFGRDFMEYGT